jgi:hypothetical protein
LNFIFFFNIIVTEAHMFWWLYRSPYRVEDSSKPWPIVLWLQGGPVSITELIKIKFESEFWIWKTHFLCLCMINEMRFSKHWMIGCFRCWNWKFWRGWTFGYKLRAKEFNMVVKSRSLVCGNESQSFIMKRVFFSLLLEFLVSLDSFYS